MSEIVMVINIIFYFFKMTLPYLIPVLLVIGGVLWPKSKVIFHVIILYIYILITFNTISPDYAVNKWMYEDIFHKVWTNFEPGSVAVAKVCNMLGLSFVGYRGVVAFISLFILSCAIKKITKKRALAATIALIYPCVTFASGLRSAIAFSICIFSFTFLTGDKKSLKKFFVANVIATLFHYSAAFNFIYLLWEKRITFRKFLGIISLELVGLILLRANFLYAIMYSFFPSLKLLEWIKMGEKESPSLLAFFVYCILYVILFVAVYYMIEYKDIKTKKDSKQFMILSGLYLPLLAFNFTFERALMFGVFFLFLHCMENAKKGTGNVFHRRRCWEIKRVDVLLVLFAIALNIISYFWINKNIYFPILENNYLFL